jgi:phage terminase large subunit-like protein
MARDYARDVVAGRQIAGKLVRLACQRHLDGLRHQREKGYPYRLDAAKANKVCRFVELMPHVKGRWARSSERIRLEPWQAFIEVNVFGWVRKSDRKRRYRRVYVEVPRKNAKSTLTAGNANYMLVADDEHGAEVYSGATTEKQAWEVFGPARLMAKGTPAFLEQFGVTVGAKNLHVEATASKFEPIIGKPGDGASPSFAVTDEYHEHQTSEQYDTMLTGMGAREQPIAWAITTAGADTAGPCYALRSSATDTLEENVSNDDLFAYIATIDDGDDWASPDALRKANPNLGVSVSEEFLRGAQLRAVSDPREQAVFKTKHLNLWVTAAAPYFNAEAWAKLRDPAVTSDAFAGEECLVAVDLAATQDITAKIKLFARTLAGRKHYYVLPSFYVPRASTEKPENRHYASWVAEGHMAIGSSVFESTMDYGFVESDIKDDAVKHSVREIVYDAWDATASLNNLGAALGTERMVQIPMNTEMLSHPMKTLRGLIDDGLVHHDGSPVLTWMIGNVTAQTDRNDNVFPRKERPDRKIDGAVALIMALCRELRASSEMSVYNDAELMVM